MSGAPPTNNTAKHFGVDMKNSFKIAEIHFGNSRWGNQYEFTYKGNQFEVQRFGIDFNIYNAKEKIKSLRSNVDAFCLSNFPQTIRYHNRSFIHRQVLELINYPSQVPICSGWALRELLLIDGINRAIKNKKVDPTEGIFFPSGLLFLDVIKELREKYEKHLCFSDIFMATGLPVVSQPTSSSLATSSFLHLANLRSLDSNLSFKNLQTQPMGSVLAFL